MAAYPENNRFGPVLWGTLALYFKNILVVPVAFLMPVLLGMGVMIAVMAWNTPGLWPQMKSSMASGRFNPVEVLVRGGHGAAFSPEAMMAGFANEARRKVRASGGMALEKNRQDVSAAPLYKWQDATGEVHFSDTLPDGVTGAERQVVKPVIVASEGSFFGYLSAIVAHQGAIWWARIAGLFLLCFAGYAAMIRVVGNLCESKSPRMLAAVREGLSATAIKLCLAWLVIGLIAGTMTVGLGLLVDILSAQVASMAPVLYVLTAMVTVFAVTVIGTFVGPAIVLEFRSIGSALKRSVDLGRGHYLRNFMLVVTVSVVTGVMLAAAGFGGSMARTAALLPPVASDALPTVLYLALMPLLVAATVVLYYGEVRERKEMAAEPEDGGEAVPEQPVEAAAEGGTTGVQPQPLAPAPATPPADPEPVAGTPPPAGNPPSEQ